MFVSAGFSHSVLLWDTRAQASDAGSFCTVVLLCMLAISVVAALGLYFITDGAMLFLGVELVLSGDCRRDMPLRHAVRLELCRGLSLALSLCD